MDKMSVIKALQTGLAGGLDIIDYLMKKHSEKDPIILHEIEKLKSILQYSAHVHDEHPDKKHQLYDN